MSQTYAHAFDMIHIFKSKIIDLAFYKVQTSVGQRIKFLLEHYNTSARNFSKQLGVAENNTQNYIREAKPAIPNADYLERIILHFKSINPTWLLTGQGEPFIPPTRDELSNDPESTKFFYRSPIVGKNSGKLNQQQNIGSTPELHDDSVKLAMALREIESLQAQLASANALLAAEKALVASKDDFITLLRASYNRPN